MDKKVLKSEILGMRYILVSCFLLSLFLTVHFMLIISVYKENYDSTDIWRLTIIFFFFYALYMLLFLLTRKSFDYYVEDGKLICKSNKGKIYVFDLKSVYTVYLSKTKSYSGIQIVQKEPKKQKVSLLLKKDDDFLGWLKNEVESYKKSNPEADLKIEYKSFEKLFLVVIWFIIIQILFTLNLIFLNNILILLVYTVLLSFLTIRMTKVMCECKKVIRFVP